MLVSTDNMLPCSQQGSTRPGQTNEADSHAILDQFVAAGGNFIDTADIYQYGISETFIGNWLAKNPQLRKKLIIATKLCGAMDPSETNSCGLSRHHIMQAAEDSLKRLQTTYIDLYQVSISRDTITCIINASRDVIVFTIIS